MSFLRLLNKNNFTPQSLGDLSLWLDASDLSTITESGGSVSQWGDKSLNGNDVTQGSGSKQPTTDASTQNGKNVLDFDGSDTLSMPSALFAIPNGSNTIFVVCKTTLTTTVQRIINLTDAGGGTRYEMEYPVDAGEVHFQNRNSFDAFRVAITGITETNFNILRGRRSSTTQAISANGGAESTNTSGEDVSDINQADIGSRRDTDGYLTGSIAEIIIYSRSLSAPEISKIENYLSNKWGVTLS